MIITHNLAHTFIVLMQFKLDLCSEYKTQHTLLHFHQLGVGQIIQQSMMMFTCILLMDGVYSIHIVMLLASCHLEIVELSK